MTVYVDDMRLPARVGRLEARWSHLLADTDEELHAFAASIGLRRSWAQYPGTWKSHYDVTDSKRAEAIRAGALALGAPPENLNLWPIGQSVATAVEIWPFEMRSYKSCRFSRSTSFARPPDLDIRTVSRRPHAAFVSRKGFDSRTLRGPLMSEVAATV